MSRSPNPPRKAQARENAEISFAPATEAGDPLFAVQARFEEAHLSQDGVEGVGTGRDSLGNPAVVVYVRDAGVARRLPGQFEGYAVLAEVVGAIDAY